VNHSMPNPLRQLAAAAVLVGSLLLSAPGHAIDADMAISRFGTAVGSKDAVGEREMMALPGFATLVDGTGRTPLFPVARAGRIDLAETLVAAKVDVNKRDSQGRSALLHAVVAERKDMVDWLVRKGASVQGSGDAEPLRAAVIVGRADIVRTLLAAGARVFPRLPDYPSSDALDTSIGASRPEMLRVLLETTEAKAMPAKEVERLKFVASQLGDAASIQILDEFERARADAAGS
jgi:hypothetical protein